MRGGEGALPVELRLLREELLPGLENIIVQATERYAISYVDWRAVYGSSPSLFVPAKPHIWVPKLTLPEAALVGAAAAIIKNPEVTRRFWQGWFK
jgi:hypothetical protein